MIRDFALVAFASLAVACAPGTPRATSAKQQLEAQVDRRVELRGEFGGLGKDGWFIRYHGVPIFLVGAGPLPMGRVGAPVSARGVLRHEGDPNPTGCGSDGQPCPVVAGREGFTLDDASVEFED